MTMSVLVADEEDDDLVVTWIEGGKVLGTGTILEYSKLEPGERTVKVTVSDGEATVEDEFTITITKEPEPSIASGPRLWIIIVIAVVVIGVGYWQWRGKGSE